MRQNEFIDTHRSFWERLEKTVDAETRATLGAEDKKSLPADYRKLCHHLSLAKLRNYSPALQDRLNELALKTHQLFYQANSRLLSRIGVFFMRDFPQSVRDHKYYVLVASLLFFGPLFGMIAGVMDDPSLAYTVIDSQTAEDFKSMYSEPSSEKDRTAMDDVGMFGYYIWNNVSIALRTFASGLLLGIGAIFILLFNGLTIGTVAGFITAAGFGENFWSFVSGHGSFELMAIVLSGAAGMKIGFAALMPGRLSRAQAIKTAGRGTVPMIYGFSVMLVLAAGIEAFWSPAAGIPPLLKYWVGGILWVLVLGYLFLAGRGARND